MACWYAHELESGGGGCDAGMLISIVGPDVNGLGQDVPEDCRVNRAIYTVRHGSRYPDLGAWKEWQAFTTRYIHLCG